MSINHKEGYYVGQGSIFSEHLDGTTVELDARFGIIKRGTRAYYSVLKMLAEQNRERRNLKEGLKIHTGKKFIEIESQLNDIIDAANLYLAELEPANSLPT